MSADRDAVRRAVRVTSQDLTPGDRVAAWNDHDAPHREVVRTYLTPRDVLIEWPDRTITRHLRWAVWHKDVRI